MITDPCLTVISQTKHSFQNQKFQALNSYKINVIILFCLSKTIENQNFLLRLFT